MKSRWTKLRWTRNRLSQINPFGARREWFVLSAQTDGFRQQNLRLRVKLCDCTDNPLLLGSGKFGEDGQGEHFESRRARTPENRPACNRDTRSIAGNEAAQDSKSRSRSGARGESRAARRGDARGLHTGGRYALPPERLRAEQADAIASTYVNVPRAPVSPACWRR